MHKFKTNAQNLFPVNQSYNYIYNTLLFSPDGVLNQIFFNRLAFSCYSQTKSSVPPKILSMN